MLNPVEAKDPDESKIYTMDWTEGLNDTATISTSTWTVTSGITNAADTIVTGSLKTTLRLTGGTAGATYTCTNRITTSDGETLERSGQVRVRAL